MEHPGPTALLSPGCIWPIFGASGGGARSGWPLGANPARVGGGAVRPATKPVPSLHRRPTPLGVRRHCRRAERARRPARPAGVGGAVSRSGQGATRGSQRGGCTARSWRNGTHGVSQARDRRGGRHGDPSPADARGGHAPGSGRSGHDCDGDRPGRLGRRGSDAGRTGRGRWAGDRIDRVGAMEGIAGAHTGRPDNRQVGGHRSNRGRLAGHPFGRPRSEGIAGDMCSGAAG